MNQATQKHERLCAHAASVTHLPPVNVILVDYLQDVSCLKP